MDSSGLRIVLLLCNFTMELLLHGFVRFYKTHVRSTHQRMPPFPPFLSDITAIPRDSQADIFPQNLFPPLLFDTSTKCNDHKVMLKDEAVDLLP